MKITDNESTVITAKEAANAVDHYHIKYGPGRVGFISTMIAEEAKKGRSSLELGEELTSEEIDHLQKAGFVVELSSKVSVKRILGKYFMTIGKTTTVVTVITW